ncbi:unnamed protein product [Microthlaspi erraticum]|uniref:Uncharacterized protein n=1 Tax=Microthlaspi erraticum TaxID=1685480 RepID=A0A6D2L2L0_9BRAS|nr:unnamed protein product [Microthlaspi erraticum]
MASHTNLSFVFPADEEEVIGHPTPLFSATPPPRRRQWWSRPIAIHPAFNGRQPTFKEKAAYCSPCCGGLFTFVAVILILYFADKAHCHAKFSIQSITVLPPPPLGTLISS